MAIISEIFARWILDSRGLPTVKAVVTVEQNGKKITTEARVPSGASTGSYEALELRDGDASKFHKKGVEKAVLHINQDIRGLLLNKDFQAANEIDQLMIELDGTHNKSALGANAILAVSMATHRAFASLYNLDLWQYLRRLYFSNLPNSRKFPRLMCNVINGGQHADNPLDIQEFMIVPKTLNLESDIRLASEVYHTLKANLHTDKQSTALGDEGGFAPNIESTDKVLNYLEKAIADTGYDLNNCDLAMDCAANEFYDEKEGLYKIEGKELNYQQLVEYYGYLTKNFKVISIEDGLQEDDVAGWSEMTQKLGDKIKLIGDDLFVTNPKRFVEIGLKNNLANGVLIKLNQIGSVLETCEMINAAKNNNYITIVSHRSGETEDTFISDLAFASQSEFIKLGAPARGERVAKFNRLLEIYDDFDAS